MGFKRKREQKTDGKFLYRFYVDHVKLFFFVSMFIGIFNLRKNISLTLNRINSNSFFLCYFIRMGS